MKLRYVPLTATFALCLCAPAVAPIDPSAQDREAANTAPNRTHWLGTDGYGRDLWSRFVHGGRWSLGIGASATALVMMIGTGAGTVAGYFGGRIDRAAMAMVELLLSMPWLYLLVGARALLPLDMPPRAAFAMLVLLIALVSWARLARLVRGVVLSLREREYVAAARGFSVPDSVILRRHILPGTLGILSSQVLILLPRFVLAEVTLSYLGLGTGEPDPGWGGLILPVKQAYLLPLQWWKALPALLMTPFFASLAITARDAARKAQAS